MTELFKTAQDLLEDFKQFLPESAAQARAAAAAKAAADEAASYPNSSLGPPGPGQAGAQARLPPVGNFAPPPSVGKETKGKKRPGLATQQEQKADAAAAVGNAQGRGGPKVDLSLFVHPIFGFYVDLVVCPCLFVVKNLTTVGWLQWGMSY